MDLAKSRSGGTDVPRVLPRRRMRQAVLMGAVPLAPQIAPGRQGPRRIASPGRPITRSGCEPRAGAARWMEDRGKMVDGNEARVLGRADERSWIGEDGDGGGWPRRNHSRSCRGDGSKAGRPGFRSTAPRSRASAATAVAGRGVGAPTRSGSVDQGRMSSRPLGSAR